MTYNFIYTKSHFVLMWEDIRTSHYLQFWKYMRNCPSFPSPQHLNNLSTTLFFKHYGRPQALVADVNHVTTPQPPPPVRCRYLILAAFLCCWMTTIRATRASSRCVLSELRPPAMLSASPFARLCKLLTVKVRPPRRTARTGRNSRIA